MSLSSMTGYVQLPTMVDGRDLVWDVKSVNSRGLDVRCRLPTSLDRLEAPLRQAVARTFKRGSITISVQLAKRAEGAVYGVDDVVLDRYGRIAVDAAARLGLEPPRIEGLMQLPGVVQRDGGLDAAGEPETAVAGDAYLAVFDDVLRSLKQSRDGEGARLKTVLIGHVDEIEQLVSAATVMAAAQPGAIRDRLTAQLAEVMGRQDGVAPERLAQEIAMLAVKADIREELDRLGAHVAEARQRLEAGGLVGRRLDFLSQEFNREANTLCSKSSDIPLNRIGLDLKAVIDRLREQVQNIE